MFAINHFRWCSYDNIIFKVRYALKCMDTNAICLFDIDALKSFYTSVILQYASNRINEKQYLHHWTVTFAYNVIYGISSIWEPCTTFYSLGGCNIIFWPLLIIYFRIIVLLLIHWGYKVYPIENSKWWFSVNSLLTVCVFVFRSSYRISSSFGQTCDNLHGW